MASRPQDTERGRRHCRPDHIVKTTRTHAPNRPNCSGLRRSLRSHGRTRALTNGNTIRADLTSIRLTSRNWRGRSTSQGSRSCRVACPRCRQEPDRAKTHGNNAVPSGHADSSQRPGDFVAADHRRFEKLREPVLGRHRARWKRPARRRPHPPLLLDTNMVTGNAGPDQDCHAAQNGESPWHADGERRQSRDNHCNMRPTLPDAQLARRHAAEMLECECTAEQEDRACRRNNDQIGSIQGVKSRKQLRIPRQATGRMLQRPGPSDVR